jgi:UDP-N-acetylglucosamine transferase subunit ALG13
VIFVTVGTQLPFERLVGAVDAWAAARSPRPEVLAQVGSGRADYTHVRCERTLDGQRYAEVLARARLMVAHAGTGSILSALDQGVPVIVFPRDDLYGEHRDDHQKQTARRMESMGLVSVAWTEAELVAMIECEVAKPASSRRPRKRNTELVDYLRGWLADTLDRPEL